MVGRSRRRRGVGPRGARHEGPGGCERGRVRVALREGFRPAGDLVFAATADEEVGDGFGLEWLVREHPELVRVDYAINEGGGERVELGRLAVLPLRRRREDERGVHARVRGRSGHASTPGIADNALVKAAPCISALGAFGRAVSLIPEVERFFEVTLGEVPPAEDALARARAELGRQRPRSSSRCSR